MGSVGCGDTGCPESHRPEEAEQSENILNLARISKLVDLLKIVKIHSIGVMLYGFQQEPPRLYFKCY